LFSALDLGFFFSKLRGTENESSWLKQKKIYWKSIGGLEKWREAGGEGSAMAGTRGTPMSGNSFSPEGVSPGQGCWDFSCLWVTPRPLLDGAYLLDQGSSHFGFYNRKQILNFHLC
jgi:hypothetical protein